MADNKNIKVFQIFYNEETRALLDPAFIPLDNSANARPDWAEYWPIRNLFSSTQFDDDDYVGVFSPRFHEKTRLSGEQVLARIKAGNADAFSFSPSFDQIALHLNPFEQGERKHPGLIAVTEKLLDALSVSLDIRNLVCDQATTVYANYFVTRYSVWKHWLVLAEKIFDLCEAQDTALAEQLGAGTRHREANEHPMKVFVMERLITIILEQHGLTARYCMDLPPLKPGAGMSLPGWLLTCESLKGQYLKTGNRAYLDIFRQIRGQLFAQLGLTLPATSLS